MEQRSTDDIAADRLGACLADDHCGQRRPYRQPASLAALKFVEIESLFQAGAELPADGNFKDACGPDPDHGLVKGADRGGAGGERRVGLAKDMGGEGGVGAEDGTDLIGSGIGLGDDRRELNGRSGQWLQVLSRFLQQMVDGDGVGHDVRLSWTAGSAAGFQSDMRCMTPYSTTVGLGGKNMTKVVVWGTGNVGRPAIRAVAAHRDLELAGVIVADPAKVGVDAGTLANIAPMGVAATADTALATAPEIDAVVYTVNADFRPGEAQNEVVAVLESGTNVVTPSFYPLYHPPSAPAAVADPIVSACGAGGSSIFASGIDPGWICDVLPLFLTSVSADITEIRSQEIFNYALYDQPEAVRTLIGFGGPMEATPPMLLDFALEMVWGPVVRVVADGLRVEIDELRVEVEKRPLERTVHVDGMGAFEEGTLGAFRFEVQGIVGGRPLIVMEHITRIDDDCAPEWPRPHRGQGLHAVTISGRPELTVEIHGSEHGEPGAAGGGNATAANRIVNAIPDVVTAEAGILHPLDVGRGVTDAQIRRV